MSNKELEHNTEMDSEDNSDETSGISDSEEDK